MHNNGGNDTQRERQDPKTPRSPPLPKTTSGRHSTSP
jgi:hypothetical protein